MMKKNLIQIFKSFNLLRQVHLIMETNQISLKCTATKKKQQTLERQNEMKWTLQITKTM